MLHATGTTCKKSNKHYRLTQQTTTRGSTLVPVMVSVPVRMFVKKEDFALVATAMVLKAHNRNSVATCSLALHYKDFV
jgi:hypothetical protein